MHSLVCPHRVSYVQCRDCNCNAICIHGYIRDMCEVCLYSELCVHNRKKQRCTLCQKTGLKQCHVFYTICSALEKALPLPMSKLIPKNERWNTTQEHIASLSRDSKTMNSPRSLSNPVRISHSFKKRMVTTAMFVSFKRSNFGRP